MNTKQKKALYESIMKQVSKTVKKAINESYYEDEYDPKAWEDPDFNVAPEDWRIEMLPDELWKNMENMPLTKYFCKIKPTKEAYDYLKQIIDITDNTLTTIAKMFNVDLKDRDELEDNTGLYFLIYAADIIDKNGETIYRNIDSLTLLKLYQEDSLFQGLTLMDSMDYKDEYMAKTIQTLIDKVQPIKYKFTIAEPIGFPDFDRNTYKSMLNFRKYTMNLGINNISFELGKDGETWVTIEAPTMDGFINKYKQLTTALISFAKKGGLNH